eukprot:1863403-Rhodomonas_salina.2
MSGGTGTSTAADVKLAINPTRVRCRSRSSRPVSAVEALGLDVGLFSAEQPCERGLDGQTLWVLAPMHRRHLLQRLLVPVLPRASIVR